MRENLKYLREATCPVEVLIDKALNDQDEYVRAVAVVHDFCPAEIIGHVAINDPHYGPRGEAVCRKNCPPDALAFAALNDPNPKVRQAAVRHPNCPLDALMAALHDTDKNVAFYASKNNGVKNIECIDHNNLFYWR